MATCNVNDLLASAACFTCQPSGILQVLELQLLCEINSMISGGGGSGVQFIEAASDTPTGNPTDPSLPAFYLGNANGTFYVWSITNAAWTPIVSV